ncbi:hypothetical protein B0H11DRAFT_1932911 [Mycena galericulata]|nr:hypothetical protein B0H11DRAFT_1932911 [Mycena galericulata]
MSSGTLDYGSLETCAGAETGPTTESPETPTMMSTHGGSTKRAGGLTEWVVDGRLSEIQKRERDQFVMNTRRERNANRTIQRVRFVATTAAKVETPITINIALSRDNEAWKNGSFRAAFLRLKYAKRTDANTHWKESFCVHLIDCGKWRSSREEGLMQLYLKLSFRLSSSIIRVRALIKYLVIFFPSAAEPPLIYKNHTEILLVDDVIVLKFKAEFMTILRFRIHDRKTSEL